MNESLTYKASEKIQMERKRVSEMSKSEVLTEAIVRWVQMSGHRNFLKNAMESNDRERAYKEIKHIVTHSGRGGCTIDFSMFGNQLEVKTFDGRVYYPTIKQLYDLYCADWETKNGMSLFSFAE